MRNITVKILIAVMAFAIGVMSDFIVLTPHQPLIKKPVPLCDVTERRSRANIQPSAEKEFVNLQGYLYGGKTLSFGDAKLSACEGSMAEVVIADEQKLSQEIQALIGTLNNEADFIRLADLESVVRIKVNLIGTLEERKWHCFGARYVITATQITPEAPATIEIKDSNSLLSESNETP